MIDNKKTSMTKSLMVMAMVLGFSTVSLAQTSPEVPPMDPPLPEVENYDATAVEGVDFSKDPCPEPVSALGETPNDLKIIQEDITRFTLCLERAQLLERLNTLALENIDTIGSSLESDTSGSMPTMAPMAMPEISAPAIPAPSQDYMNNDVETSYAAPAAPTSDWSVKDITGNGDSLTATLTDENDNIIRVKKGDKIPDTDIKIISVLSTEVSVKNNGSVQSLQWAN